MEASSVKEMNMKLRIWGCVRELKYHGHCITRWVGSRKKVDLEGKG